jgi:lambda family phage minor tail protein L
MPENIDKQIAIEKNKLAGGGAWLWLLDIAVEGQPTLHLVNNITDIIYRGTAYTKCNFQMEAYDKSEPGRLSELNLNVTNADLIAAVLPYVNAYDGLIGSTITRTPVNANHLNIDMSAKAEDFVVTGCSAGEEWISFVLGAPSPLNRKFPARRFFAAYCRYVGRFKGIECGYSGAETVCNGTPEDCQDNKNNLERFGGQPGLRSKTVSFA